jgi:hypothetical protein
MIKVHESKVVLEPFLIDKICSSWGDFKYTNVFKIIATYIAPLTHEIMNLAPCNNVPDNVSVINKKLFKYGLACRCTPQVNKSPVGNSHHWYLVKLPTQELNKAYGERV